MNVLVAGGAGYVGAMLVPWLLVAGHRVTVYDAMWFGNACFPDNDKLTVIKGDVRSVNDMDAACDGQDAVICLAAMSAEEMCRRDRTHAHTVNIGGALSVACSAMQARVKRFIYASSVAAYVSQDKDSVEGDEMHPTTIYGECKVEAERLVNKYRPDAVIVRSASVCGYSPRMRLDLIVNMMVHDAVRKGVITVNGGRQKRSHIHMHDICDFYTLLLDVPHETIAGQTFNVVAENEAVKDTARQVANVIGARIVTQPRSDNRSYTVDGTKAREVLGFVPRSTVRQAVIDMKARFDSGYWKDSMTNKAYMNFADGII